MSECDYLSNYEAIVLFCLEWYRASSLKKILCYIAEYSRDQPQFSGQQPEKSEFFAVICPVKVHLAVKCFVELIVEGNRY